MIKNLLLDYNGVISDDFSLLYLSVMKVFQKFNRKTISINEFKREFTVPIYNFYAKYLPNVPFEKHSKYYFKAYKQLGQPKMFPYVKETISELNKKRVSLIIISSHNKKFIVSELKKFDINLNFFKAIYGNVIDKESFLSNLLSSKKFSFNETAYVGDTEYDIFVAKRVNIKSIASTYGYRKRAQLSPSNPDFFIDNFSALLKFF